MRSTLAWSASEASTVPPNLRLVFFSFDVRIWRILVWPRLILPVPVFLKRLAAPLCVLSFGMGFLSKVSLAQHRPVYGRFPSPASQEGGRSHISDHRCE